MPTKHGEPLQAHCLQGSKVSLENRCFLGIFFLRHSTGGYGAMATKSPATKAREEAEAEPVTVDADKICDLVYNLDDPEGLEKIRSACNAKLKEISNAK